MNELNNTMNEAMENVAEAMPKTGGSGNLVAFVAGVSATLLIEGGIKLAKRAWNKHKAQVPAAESNEKKEENDEQPKEENDENK